MPVMLFKELSRIKYLHQSRNVLEMLHRFLPLMFIFSSLYFELARAYDRILNFLPPLVYVYPLYVAINAKFKMRA